MINDRAPMESTDPDVTLMLLVRDGDTVAFEQLLNRYHGAIVNFIYRIVNNAPIAEELAQDVFLKVFKARKSYEPRAPFKSWLYRIAANTSLKAMEKERRSIFHRVSKRGEDYDVYQQIADPSPDAEKVVQQTERSTIVRGAIRSLPVKQRIAIVLRRYEGLSYREIASVMGCTEAAVKTHIHRGKLHLRDRLLPYIIQGRI